MVLKYNKELEDKYFILLKEMTKVILFVLCCRYLKSINKDKLENISDFIREEINDIEEIRKYLDKGK